MRYFLTIFFLLGIGSVSADEKTMLYDFRYWTAPDHTRIVIDTQENAFYDIFTSKDYIILRVENAKVLPDTFSHLFFQDKRIERAQIKRDHETLKLIFHTKDLYSVKYFNLPPNQKYKYHRLVIDLYDSISSKSKTKVAIEKPTSTDKTIIVVDAGHGGEDSGAVGKNKTREKDVNLAIAKKLVNTINKNKDLSAVLTRNGDYYIPLTKRITIAQNQQATMFISIHADAVESTSAKGASIYTLSEKGNNSKLAKQLEQSENSVDQFGGVETVIDSDQFLKSILTDFSRQDRENQSQKLASQVLEELSKIGPVHKKTPQKANFVVLKAPTIPSILVETAFISNPIQEKRLGNSKEQQKIADAIYKGVIDYFEEGKEN